MMPQGQKSSWKHFNFPEKITITKITNLHHAAFSYVISDTLDVLCQLDELVLENHKNGIFLLEMVSATLFVFNHSW